MKTRAAVLRDVGKPFEIVELDLDEPKTGEVLVEFAASGLCHSDDHLRTGDIPVRYPIVGGHEGAGIVEQVGDGRHPARGRRHVVASWLPVCGNCRFCARGQTNLCDLGRSCSTTACPTARSATTRARPLRADVPARDVLAVRRAVEASVVKIEDDIPLELAALTSCGVPTGFGSAVKAGEVKPGDTTIVYGIGGVGVNALQGASIAGARYVIAEVRLNSTGSTAMTYRAGERGALHRVVPTPPTP